MTSWESALFAFHSPTSVTSNAISRSVVCPSCDSCYVFIDQPTTNSEGPFFLHSFIEILRGEDAKGIVPARKEYDNKEHSTSNTDTWAKQAHSVIYVFGVLL